MANIICWICKDNLAHQKYDGSKLLDEDGSKPCFECLMEDFNESEDFIESDEEASSNE